MKGGYGGAGKEEMMMGGGGNNTGMRRLESGGGGVYGHSESHLPLHSGMDMPSARASQNTFNSYGNGGIQEEVRHNGYGAAQQYYRQ
jgi:hypothetical protein